MRDLEIRGAGNLLGTGQSGHIAAVGYDLYCQMVTEAVAELKGEPLREPAEIKLDLPLDANLPDGLRRQGGPAPRGLPPAGRGHDRAARSTTSGPSGIDRYGPVPDPAEALLDGRPAAGRVRPHRRPRGHRHQGQRRVRRLRRAGVHGPHLARRPAHEQDHPPRAPLQGRRLQGRGRPAPAARSRRPTPRRAPSSMPCGDLLPVEDPVPA